MYSWSHRDRLLLGRHRRNRTRCLLLGRDGREWRILHSRDNCGGLLHELRHYGNARSLHDERVWRGSALRGRERGSALIGRERRIKQGPTFARPESNRRDEAGLLHRNQGEIPPRSIGAGCYPGDRVGVSMLMFDHGRSPSRSVQQTLKAPGLWRRS